MRRLLLFLGIIFFVPFAFGMQSEGRVILNLDGVHDIIESEGRFDFHKQSLDLSGLAIERIAGDVFRQMHKVYPDLVKLDLSSNSLDYLSDDIGWLSSLRSLDLSNNRLRGLPAGLHPMIGGPSLTKLNLSNNRLGGIPAVLEDCVSLQELNLQYNELTNIAAIADAVRRMRQLEHLWLFGNRLPPPSTWSAVRESLIKVNPNLHIHYHAPGSSPGAPHKSG